MTPRWPLLVVVASSVAMAGVVLAGLEGPGRALLTAWFLVVCTGMAFVPLLAVGPAVPRLVLAVAIGLAIDTAVATAMLAAGRFSAPEGLLILVALALVGCGLQLRREPPGYAISLYAEAPEHRS